MRHISLMLLLLLPLPGLAEAPPKAPPEFEKLKYRCIGPASGGRVSRVAGVPGDPLTYYAAAASSGVWKSTDGGITFQPIFDDQSTSSIGSIAVAASDPNVIYVGTGEANIRGNVAAGNGIYKSTDAGKTWKHVWQSVGHIGTMIVHPKNPDIAFAAVLGHAFGPNPERGVYRTKNGGRSWEKVLFRDQDTGASDVCFDPNNPRILFAGMWQTRRKPWEMTSGGPGSGLHISRDGGDTWEAIGPAKKGADEDEGNGLPPGIWGKVTVAVAPSDSSRVYALIEAEKGGLYRSEDGGEKWSRVSESHLLRQRIWYFGTLTIDPTNAEVVYAPQVPLLKSIDGGKTFTPIKGAHHGDHHDIWIDPKNPKRIIDANDGGVDISTNGGRTWYAPPLPIAQFYHIACDNALPYRVMGNMQDMGTASGPSNSLTNGGIPLGDWHTVGGGETGFSIPDPTDNNIVYSGEYGGYISRYDHRTRQARNISIYPFDPSGFGAGDLKYRFQWTAPIVISKHDPKVVYHAANVLFRTTDAGQTWEKVSPDLTRNDRNKQKWSGGPITGDNTGVEFYCTIFALAESPRQQGLLWAGSDDGLVHVSRDNGKSWQNVTANIPNLPDWATITCIEPSEFDIGTAYVVADAHRLDDYKPYLWKTTDFGKTWKNLSENLDSDTYLHVAREDPNRKGLLYLGTERGVMFSLDNGENWKPLKLNMPTVAVHDLVVKNHDLVVGTMGRSIWILDDLTPIRHWKDSVKDSSAHLFTPVPTFRWRFSSAMSKLQMKGAGDNPEPGMLLSYYLKEKPKKPLKLEILDSKGVVVVTIDSKKKPEEKPEPTEEEEEEDEPEILPTEPGVNRFAWNLLHRGAEMIPGAKIDMGSLKKGPTVAPGSYLVRLTVDGKVVTTTAEVVMDKRVTQPRVPQLLGVEGVEELPIKPRERTPVPPNVEILPIKPREIPDPKAPKKSEKPVDREEIGEPISLLQQPPKKLYREPMEAILLEAKEQEQFALGVREDVTKITRMVLKIRSMRSQLRSHAEILKEEAPAKNLLKTGEGLIKKLDALEEKLHNPKAKVSYDILAQKGGAKLYSQMIWLFENVREGDGPPTQGMKELAVELRNELVKLTAEYDTLRKNDLPKRNAIAAKLGYPMVWIPAEK